MAHKKRTMITIDEKVLEASQSKCKANGQKLSPVIELFLRDFCLEK